MNDSRGPEGLHPTTTEIGISRRDVVKKTAGVGAGTLFAKLLNAEHARATGLTTYEGNTLIETDVALIQPDGWNIQVNLDQVEQYSRQNGSTVSFEALGSYASETIGFSYTNGKPDYSPGFTVPKVPIHGVNTGILETLPSHEGENYIMLLIKESKDNKITNITPIYIKLDSNAYVPEDPIDNTSVFADGDVVNDDVLEQIHKRGQRFKEVFPWTDFPIFIYKNRYSTRSGTYDPTKNLLLVPGRYFTSKEAPDMGHIVTDHERFHGVHTSNLKTISAKEADVELEKSYLELWDSIAGMTPDQAVSLLIPSEISQYPTFSIFDESTYFPELRKVEREDIGSPYKNYRELYASGMNVMTRVGDRVVEEIKNMQDSQAQARAIRFAEQILNLTDAMAEDPTVVYRVFPKLISVRDFIEEARAEAA